MRIALLSTYDLGRQPFGLASPAAWLRRDGHEVFPVDLSQTGMPEEIFRTADWFAFHLPMHTATRMALDVIRRIRSGRPDATIACFGLYAPVNEALLRAEGVAHVIGGEFESGLADVMSGRSSATLPVILDRLPFLTPDRSGLPPLSGYSRVVHDGIAATAGYTEASRGCKHLCRHCPIVPVYEGRFRIVPQDVVLADVRQQAAAGAQHITFGDPDFLNGPGHALPLIEEFHSELPDLTYDVTIKVEHLLKHRDALPVLKRTGCLFITSAVESMDDGILERLRKGHTRVDFEEALRLTRDAGLALAPTFVAFTPWTTREIYRDLLDAIRDLDLVENVAPVQLAIRLLIPAGSRLLELTDLHTGPFDAEALSYRWQHPDPAMDELARDLLRLVRNASKRGLSRTETYALIRERALGEAPDFRLPARATIPYLTEPWYC